MAKEIETTSYDESLVNTLTSPREIAEYFASLGVDIVSTEADGIVSLDVVDKETLIGTPFVIIEWRFNDTGKFGTFVSAVFMTEDGKRGVFNDGSTGIAQQLRELSDYREAHNHATPYAGRFVKGGLRVSDYTYVDEKGNDIPARTFYLAW